MKRLLTLIILSFTLIHCADSRKFKVGEPDSWNMLGGANVKVGEMSVKNKYWIEDHEDTLSFAHKLLLVNRDEYKTILDTLNIGVLDSAQSIDYGTVELNEQEDPTIVALYTKDDSFYHRNIIKAWKVNLEKGRFQDFSTQGIRVKNIDQHYR